MVNLNKIKRGLSVDSTTYDHLQGRMDIEAFLEDLGIDFSHRAGRNQLMCHCPDLYGNHKNGDANPSFGFNEEKLIFNCLAGCYSGNVLELVQLMRPDLEDDTEALRYAEQFADLNVSADDLVAKVQRILNPVEEEETLPDYPPENLFQYRKIHPWLLERGISKEVIVEMQVGYDDEHLGIVIPHFFMGKLVGMQRRHLAQDSSGFRCPRCELDEKGRVPKYKNTTKFPKVNTLYGYDQMKEHMKQDGGTSIIVVESPMSVLRLKSLGFHRVVATFGSFSKEQAMTLIAIPTVYFWPDNDAAGKKNLDAAVDNLGKFVDLRIVPAVDGDPGSDAANLAETGEILEYLKAAYPASLVPLYSPETAATFTEAANTN